MSLIHKFRKPDAKANIQDEVIEHLTDFLNTKRNFGAYPMDYGIDSYIYMGTGKQIVVKIIADIEAGLSKYEKRIHAIEISEIPTENAFQLAFKIQCKIQTVPLSFQISFHHQKNTFEQESDQ